LAPVHQELDVAQNRFCQIVVENLFLELVGIGLKVNVDPSHFENLRLMAEPTSFD